MSAEFALLTNIVIVLSISVAVVFICHILRIPALVGFLLSGVVAGPSVLALVSDPHQVSLLAEIGVVLLLFTIGMELSLDSLWRFRRTLFIGGSVQVFGTIAFVIAIGSIIGFSLKESLFFSFLVSLSSTAIVFKILQDRREIDAPHGKASTAIAIFQDIMIVPMMLITSVLAGSVAAGPGSILVLIGKIIGIMLVLGVLAKWVVPWLLFQVARTRIRELFLLAVVILCFLVTWLTSSVGLSLALGAFAAGLIISESPYSDQALGLVQSLRDLFVSFFFVTIGMLIDIRYAFENIVALCILALVVVTFKGVIALAAARIVGHTLRTAIWTGVYLSQVGEFAFVLSAVGLTAGLLNDYTYQTFLSISLLTMISTPILISFLPRIFRLLRITRPIATPESGAKPPEDALQDHLIIVGYGVNGRNLSRACKAAGIPYVILEVNPDTVRNERANGEPIMFGDAAQEPVLHKAGIHSAKVAVIAISDPPTTRRVVKMIKAMSPSVQVIARTRYINEMQVLFERGADDVIPEEFETSIEILNRVMHAFMIPDEEIAKFIGDVRADGYSMFRSLQAVERKASDLRRLSPDIEITTYRVNVGASIEGKTFGEVGLRSQYGATAIAVKKGEKTISNPGPDIRVESGDVVIVMGESEKAAGVAELFKGME